MVPSSSIAAAMNMTVEITQHAVAVGRCDPSRENTKRQTLAKSSTVPINRVFIAHPCRVEFG